MVAFFLMLARGGLLTTVLAYRPVFHAGLRHPLGVCADTGAKKTPPGSGGVCEVSSRVRLGRAGRLEYDPLRAALVVAPVPDASRSASGFRGLALREFLERGKTFASGCLQ